jgi:ribosome-associated protein
VELRIDVGASSLPPEVKSRLLALAGRHATKDGVLVVVSRRHHSQSQNRTAARAELASLLAAKDPPTRRTQSHPDSAVRERRLSAKHRRSATKQGRALRALV